MSMPPQTPPPATAHEPAPHYPWRHAVTTRWADNDIYGHVNNAVYYQYFDSAINALLIEKAGLDIQHGTVVGFIVRSECDYLKPVAYPGTLEVGVAVERLGGRSVTYRVALFSAQGEPCARGRMVHVFVDTAHGRSVAVPETTRQALLPYLLPSSAADAQAKAAACNAGAASAGTV
ncbi:MAG: acyl-CoA thioesterase [Rubrivivax sp.]